MRIKKGKKKAKKDPEAPKRTTSSYMYFAIDKRESVTKKQANTPPTEIMKILVEMWNKLDKGKNGIKKYDDLAAEDKARYESEKAE
jgi:structure-specific recognition protein 1